MRKVLAIFVGIIVSVVLLLMLENLSHKLYPPPSDLDMNNTESVNQYLKEMPVGALLIVLFSHFVSLTIGNYLALKISQGYKTAVYTVGGIFGFMVGLNLWLLDHPLWFSIADVVFVLLAIWIPLKFQMEKNVN